MIEKFKKIVVEEVEVVKMTKENLLEVINFLDRVFDSDDDILEFRDTVSKTGKLFLNIGEIATFGDYIVKDKKGFIRVLDELGYKQLKKQFGTDEETTVEKEKIQTNTEEENFNKFKEEFLKKLTGNEEVTKDNFQKLGNVVEVILGKNIVDKVLNTLNNLDKKD
jgi:hypothetical protein